MNSINEPREAPSDLSVCSPYAFTINVFPSKMISVTGQNKRSLKWQNIENLKQKLILHEAIMDAIHSMNKSSEDIQLQFEYELTQTGNIHVHGIMLVDINFISEFQHRIHKRLGLPSAPPQRVCYIERTIVSCKYWTQYMVKYKKVDNDYIPDKSLFY